MSEPASLPEADRGGGASPVLDERCPFPRPFDRNFSACPAYMPRLHLPRDTRGRELPASWTCAHLAAARHPSGGFFPRCKLGTAAGRARWASALKEGQLAAIRVARIELSQQIRPQLDLVRAAIGGRYDPLDTGRRSQARAAWVGLAGAFDSFVEARPALFVRAGIEPAEVRRCFAEAVAEFASRPGAGDWQMSESIVGRYPWPVVAFFRPDLISDGALSEAARQ